MNQILVTKKLYITPELRKKQTFYKFCFFMCIFLIGILFSVYIYGMYEQNLNEDISKELLGSVSRGTELYTPPEENEDILVVYLDEDVSDEDIIQVELDTELKEPNTPIYSTYTASNGKSYDIVGIINIPSVEINYPILSESTDSLLKVSVCKFMGPEPNSIGNLCIAGHNFTNNRAFSKLNKVKVDDIIEITDLSGRTIQYKVYDNFIVAPTDLSCTSQRTNGKREITLITCTNGNKQRRIVKAVEIPQIEELPKVNTNNSSVITLN